MALKLLISGEPNSGKTSLLKGLKDTLVISHDGKKFPLKMPHINVNEIGSCDDFTDHVMETVEKYNDKVGEYPKYVAFDSVSKLFESMYKHCDKSETGFKVYSKLDAEISEFMSFLEDTLLANDIGVIAISHAIFDSEAAAYKLTGKGAFNKRGGILCETDEAIFVETKNNKRTVHVKSLKYPARTLLEDTQDKYPIDKFDLQKHISAIENSLITSSDFDLDSGDDDEDE